MLSLNVLKKNLYKITIILFLFLTLIPPFVNSIDLAPITSASDVSENIIYKDAGNIKFLISSSDDKKYMNIKPEDVIFLNSDISDSRIETNSNKENSMVIFSKSVSQDKVIPLINKIDNIIANDFKMTIFMYHRFTDFPKNPYEVSVNQFEDEMRYLYENGYKTITLGQYIDAVYSKDLSSMPDKSVIITVDDGYNSFYTRAYPILKKYGFTATLFIYTNYIGSGGSSLSWGELRELVNNGMEIGSHSISHPNMASPKRMKYGASYYTFLEQELGKSREILEKNLGINIRLFAWPYGSFNETALKKAIAMGYEGIITVIPGSMNLNSDIFHIRRYGVYPSTGLELFALRLKMPVDKVIISTEEAAEMKKTGEGEYILKTKSSFITDEKSINDSYNAIIEAIEEYNKTKENNTTQ